jgi:VirE N-terminal domain
MDPEVSFGPKIQAPPEAVRRLSDVLQPIKDGKWRAEVEECRLNVARRDKQAADRLKKKLPWFTPSGVFTPNRKASDLKQHSGLFVFDFDDLKPDDLPELKQRLIQSGHVRAVFISPSGTGLKVLIPGEPATIEASHKAEFQRLRIWIEEFTHTHIDRSGSDPSRACFVSYDPDLQENEDATSPPSNLQCYTDTQRSRDPETHDVSGVVVSGVLAETELSHLSAEICEQITAHGLVPLRIHATHRALFDLARLGKSLERRLGGRLSIPEQRHLFGLWLQTVRSSNYEVLSRPPEEYGLEFLGLYPKARIPLDQTPIEFAMEQAAHTPLPPLPPEAEDFAKNDRICLLIKLLWQMSQNSSDGTFYLSCRDAARHIGQDHMTAHRWLGALRYLGLIELVEAGGNHFATGKTGTRAAATYRWKPYIGPKQLTSLQAIPA